MSQEGLEAWCLWLKLDLRHDGKLTKGMVDLDFIFSTRIVLEFPF